MDRAKQGIKRSAAVDAEGIPIGGVSAPTNRHDSPLLVPTLDNTSELVGALPEEAIVYLDRGYDFELTRERLALVDCSPRSPKGQALTAWGDEALDGGEDEFVAQRPQKAGVVHRVARAGY